MGGDHAPGHIVDGALAAVRHFELGIVLVGPATRLAAELAAQARKVAEANKGKIPLIPVR